MLKFEINQYLGIEVDKKKSDCSIEPPHCHITRYGVRVGKVWVNPVMFEPGYLLRKNEEEIVLNAVKEHEREIKEEYITNKYHGSEEDDQKIEY